MSVPVVHFHPSDCHRRVIACKDSRNGEAQTKIWLTSADPLTSVENSETFWAFR